MSGLGRAISTIGWIKRSPLGCRQIVILGAGLDTRAFRKQAPGVVYYEIDDANTLSFKQERLEAAGYRASDVFIPGNYVEQGVLPLLEANGFDRGEPAFFIWEGNTMYLSKQMNLNVLAELRDALRAFSIAFDYMSEAVIDYATGEADITKFVERFAAMGAPWQFGIDDLPAFAKEAGLSVADNVTTAESAPRLLAGARNRHAHVRPLRAVHA